MVTKAKDKQIVLERWRIRHDIQLKRKKECQCKKLYDRKENKINKKFVIDVST